MCAQLRPQIILRRSRHKNLSKKFDLKVGVLDPSAPYGRNNKIVATARVRATGEKEYKIERMAATKKYRNKGIGQGLVEHIIGHYLPSNPKRIWMQSQVQAKKFYEKCGFKAVSEPYDLHGVEHIDMEFNMELMRRADSRKNWIYSIIRKPLKNTRYPPSWRTMPEG